MDEEEEKNKAAHKKTKEEIDFLLIHLYNLERGEKMKIVLKNESCIGCGACVGIDSEHFEFSEEGYSVSFF